METGTQNQAVDYIALAVPVFFLLIGIELLVGKLRKTEYYRFNDAITNISCGIGQQVFGIFLKTLLLLGYIWLFNNARIYTFPTDTWWSWVLLFFGVDFFYYWFHRYAHEISLLWGGHIVHHQSEEYNLSVALRQGAFQALSSWIFYLPLAVFGFDPIQFVVVNQFQTLYQFWIHTEAIGKLPKIIEWFWNTPSHHRVHHGQNPQYIDKNHGGTLIIWDRLFGTFEEEKEPVVYDVTKPLASWNPVWANFDFLLWMIKTAFQTRSIGDFFRVLFKKPGWRPEYLGGPIGPREVTRKQFKKFNPTIPAGVNYYVFFQYLSTLGGASAFLFFASKMDIYWRIGLAVLIIWSIANLGGLLEAKRWSWALEVLRNLVAAGAIALFFQPTPYFGWVAAIASGQALLGLVWVMFYRKFYLNPPTMAVPS